MREDRTLPAIETCGLEVRYGLSPALTDVSLLVPKGKMTVLAGANGSGKSTLLSTMARILKPAGGSILLEGRVLAGIPTRDVARMLGLLPQGLLVPDGLTVYDLVCRGRYPHQGMLRQWAETDERAVETAIRATGLGGLAGRPVDHLSGGQRQRAFIAMTLAQETATILFDEPTTFLDLRYQVEILELISSLRIDHGRTVVAVLHDINAALQYADRIVFLKAGRIHSIVENIDDCHADLIGEVFDIGVIRLTHPGTGRPAFLPSGARQRGLP